MLSQKYLLLKAPFSCFIIIHLLLQTCTGQIILAPQYYQLCPPSSCGNIPNISYPFRLRNDPQHCGVPECELTCENNITLATYLGDSRKYVVRAINYDNFTIRLSDSAVSQNDSCSLPKYSMRNIDYYYPSLYNFTSYMRNFIITFMSCPFPVNNSLLLKVAAADCSHGKNHTYIRFGNLNGSCMMDMCTLDLMVMTSLPLKGAENSVSLSEIHNSLLYGFEVSWFYVLYDYCQSDGKKAVCYTEGHRWCDIGRIWKFSCGRMPGWFANAFGFITWKIRLGIDTYGTLRREKTQQKRVKRTRIWLRLGV